ncbi:MAG: exo-alpha-sialidase [Planctomycetes bacterium]|nr:exo-alpha-sialidase [Planctomycetota bacterium]
MRESIGCLTVLFYAIVLVAGMCLGDSRADTADGKGTQPIVKAEFVFEKAPFKECHASTIVQTGDGTLVAAWFGGTREGKPDVGIWVSRCVDGCWTSPVEMATGEQQDGKRFPCWNPVLFQPPGEAPLMLFFKVGPSPRAWWGELMASTDGGQTWEMRQRLPEGFLGPIRSKPVLLPDRTLLCGSSTEHDGWRVHFELVKHPGKDWQRVDVPEGRRKFNAIQPTILKHADGRLQALCRTKESVIAVTWSKDNGRSWSPLEPTTLPNPNAGIEAVTLADGRFLLVYNHLGSGPSGWGRRGMLNLAISKDGITWQAALVLEQERGAEFSYPAAVQTPDGLVHITYTWKRRRIKHVVVDPRKLKGVPIVDGRWPENVPIAPLP